MRQEAERRLRTLGLARRSRLVDMHGIVARVFLSSPEPLETEQVMARLDRVTLRVLGDGWWEGKPDNMAALASVLRDLERSGKLECVHVPSPRPGGGNTRIRGASSRRVWRVLES